jgi:hypothetical protein
MLYPQTMTEYDTVKFLTALFLTVATISAIPSAAAQEPAAPAAIAEKIIAGAPVFDRDGAQLGTIKSNDGSVAVIAVGDKQIAIPVASFGLTDKGIAIGATVAEITKVIADQDAKAAADLSAALVAGADVKNVDGTQVLSKIKRVEGETVYLEIEVGELGFPKSAFYLAPHGLSIAYSVDDFAKVVKEATAPQAPATPAE